MIYLDHAATTQMSERAAEAMKQAALITYANPSAGYEAAAKARAVVNRAKIAIASSLNARDTEILITSGGTEGNNFCLFSGTKRAERPVVLISAAEHPSVRECALELKRRGALVDEIPLLSNGQIDLDYAEVFLRLHPDTTLVSCMAANNETGVIQPVIELGNMIRLYAPECLFHVDAVQFYGICPINVKEWKADLITASAHKFYGPKGTGFVWHRESLVLPPLLYGGGQEEGLRSGTENVPGIAGMISAVEERQTDLRTVPDSLRALRKKLMDLLLEWNPEIRFHPDSSGSSASDSSMYDSVDLTVPGILNLSVPGISGTLLKNRLDVEGICVSTGSACANRKREPSGVLLAMGVTAEEAERSIRISLGRDNTVEQMEETVKAIKKISQFG